MGFFDQFRRKPRLTQNTAAEFPAGLIVQHALACGLELGEGKAGAPRASNAQITQASLEFLYAMLHMVDRIAFSTLRQPRRNAFMQQLEECTIDEYLSVALTGESKRHVDSFKATLFESFNERTMAYGQYRDLVPAKDAPPKGTLMWEVGTRVAQAFNAPTDIRYIMLSTPLLMQALQQLNAKEILSRLP